MQEDYLWDKTGSDAEIERLEETLRTFRYRETAPPVLPLPNTPTAQKRSRFNIWRLGYLVPAFGAIVLAVFGIWWESAPTVGDLDEFLVTAPTVEFVETAPLAEIPKTVDFQKPISQGVPETVSTQRFKTVKTAFKPLQKKRVKQIPDETAGLTKEEKEAFDRLMLALTITSSKLNIVKEKTQRTDN